MRQQIGDLYIPQDERTLRVVQRRGEVLDRTVHDWSSTVMGVLPKALPLIPDELLIARLFLAQQRRLNLELDARDPQTTVRNRLGRVLPFVGDGSSDIDMLRAVHRIVSTKLESDIDRACGLYCEGQSIPAVSDPVIDWRVAMRFMAQGLHRIASQIDFKRDYATSSKRFELALFAREAASDVSQRRRAMLSSFQKEPSSTHN